jgi:antitoxin VapB
LPAELRLPADVTRVDIRAVGPERIISPIGQSWTSFFTIAPPVADDFMAERAPQHQTSREDF